MIICGSNWDWLQNGKLWKKSKTKKCRKRHLGWWLDILSSFWFGSYIFAFNYNSNSWENFRCESVELSQCGHITLSNSCTGFTIIWCAKVCWKFASCPLWCLHGDSVPGLNAQMSIHCCFPVFVCPTWSQRPPWSQRCCGMGLSSLCGAGLLGCIDVGTTWGCLGFCGVLTGFLCSPSRR